MIRQTRAAYERPIPMDCDAFTDGTQQTVTEADDIDALGKGGRSWKGAKGKGRGRGKGSSDRLCFTCGKPGHMAKDCRKGQGKGKAVCRRCGGAGHYERQCPSPVEEFAAEDDEYEP